MHLASLVLVDILRCAFSRCQFSLGVGSDRQNPSIIDTYA